MGDLQWPKEQLVHRAGGPSVASFQSPAKLDLNESITKKSSPDQFQIPADKLSLQGPFKCRLGKKSEFRPQYRKALPAPLPV